MSHVLPNISRGRFFEPIFMSKKFDLYTSIYGIIIIQVHKIFGVDFKMGELISGKGVGGPYTLYKKVGTN